MTSQMSDKEMVSFRETVRKHDCVSLNCPWCAVAQWIRYLLEDKTLDTDQETDKSEI